MTIATRKKLAALVLPLALFIAAVGSSGSGTNSSGDSGETATTTFR